MKSTFLQIVFIFLLCTSCSKVGNEGALSAHKSTLSTNRTAIEAANGNQNVAPLNLDDLGTLPDALLTNDKPGVEVAISDIALDVSQQALIRHGIDLSDEFEDDYINIIVAFMLLEEKDKYDANPSGYNTLGCFIGAVEGILGIRDAKKIYYDFLNGATKATLVSTLKLMGRRVFWGIQIGYAIYQAGECLGWWDMNPTVQNPAIYIPDSFFAVDKITFNQYKDSIVAFTVTHGYETYEVAVSCLNSTYDDGSFQPESECASYTNNYFKSLFITAEPVDY